MVEYKIGDLVIFHQSLEWDDIRCIEGELGIIIEIFEKDDEENFFDLNIQLADGGCMPVWFPEIRKLDDAKKV